MLHAQCCYIWWGHCMLLWFLWVWNQFLVQTHSNTFNFAHTVYNNLISGNYGCGQTQFSMVVWKYNNDPLVTPDDPWLTLSDLPLTPCWHLPDPLVTPGWPSGDPWLTSGWPLVTLYWPLVTLAWLLVDPLVTLWWPLAGPLMTPGWPPGESLLTPWWHLPDPLVTPGWPPSDPLLTPGDTRLTLWWPLLTG